MDNSYDLIISIVDRGHSDLVVDASREAGARGGTIIYGRGTSNSEHDKFLGISIQPEKEIIMTLAANESKNDIMEAICEKAHLDTAGLGICFSLPVTKVRGLSKPKTENIPQGNGENIENKN